MVHRYKGRGTGTVTFSSLYYFTNKDVKIFTSAFASTNALFGYLMKVMMNSPFYNDLIKKLRSVNSDSNKKLVDEND